MAPGRGMSHRLRALTNDGGIHVLPGVYNAITAKMGANTTNAIAAAITSMRRLAMSWETPRGERYRDGSA